MYQLKMRLNGQEVGEVELVSGQEYTFGRGSNCDIVLEPESGISRTHFRVFEDNGLWTVQSTSKFGSIMYGGQTIDNFRLDEDRSFEVSSYSFQFSQISATAKISSRSTAQLSLNGTAEAPAESSVQAFAAGQSHAYQMPHLNTGSTKNSLVPYFPHVENFDGNEEATRIGVQTNGLPYLRMVEGNGDEQTLKLEGNSWVAGREDGCEILLNDRKASRRQFELSSSAQGFFIRDLGSSNGTILNGTQLAPDELRPLRSGDLLKVGKVAMYFEIRDPSFERRLMIVPPEVLATTPALNENPYEMINYPVPHGPGGAVRFDPNAGGLPAPWQGAAGDSAENLARKKKIKFYSIIGVVVFLLVIILMSGGQTGKKPAPEANTPFSRLAKQKQQVVRETYVLAKNLDMQGKYDLALAQLVKLHEILPEGYEESLKITEQCKANIDSQEKVQQLQEEQKKLEANRKIVEQTIKKCMVLAQHTTSLPDLNGCLAPALDLDPGNPQLSAMQSEVQLRVDQNSQRASEKQAYEERVARGRALFSQAEVLEAKGQIFEAMDAYKKHIDSSFPDPAGLKSKSQKNLLSITKRVSSKVEDSLSAAQSAYSTQNYKEAITQINKAKGLDPKSERAAELNAKIRHELNLKLKEIYEESVIKEGLGDPEKAAELWKKIIEMDHPEGDYYHKAKNKLKNYGKF